MLFNNLPEFGKIHLYLLNQFKFNEINYYEDLWIVIEVILVVIFGTQ